MDATGMLRRNRRRFRPWSVALAAVALGLFTGCVGVAPNLHSPGVEGTVEPGSHTSAAACRTANQLFPCIGNTEPVLPVKDLRWRCLLAGDRLSVECFHSPGIPFAGLGDPGLIRLEFELEDELREGEWWGDAARLEGPEGGLSLAAVGRGLVLAVDAPLIRLARVIPPPGAAARARRGSLIVQWDGGRTGFEALGQPAGRWRQARGSWNWRSASPATRFAAALSTPQNRDLPYPLPRDLLALDLGGVLTCARRWVEDGPAFAWDRRTFPVWRALWIEHRLASFEPAWIIPHRWEGVGRGYPPQWYGHWDLVQNLLDRVWGDFAGAQGEIDNLEAFFLEDEGRFACVIRPDTARVAAAAPPPLEPQAALRVFYRDRDRDRLARCFRMFERDFAWWWASRRTPSVGLFWWRHMLESGYDNIGRAATTIEAREAGFEDYGAVDLSSMLAMYAGDLAEMARILGNAEAAEAYQRKRVETVSAIRERLWDPERRFFGDLHVPSGRLETVLTCASFWPLAAGAATESQAAAVVDHIRSVDEFWTPFPLAAVAVNERGFDLDCWRGPVWVSQNYWVIRGLRRYGYRDEAARLALLTIDGMQRVWDRDRKVYEFYHPLEFFPDSLRRKGKGSGPFACYTGHNPLLAVILEGLWGLEPGLDGCRWNPPDVLLTTAAEASFRWGDRPIRLRSDGKGGLFSNGKSVIPGSCLPIPE